MVLKKILKIRKIFKKFCQEHQKKIKNIILKSNKK